MSMFPTVSGRLRGFTLLELIVVVGIMGMLGVSAAGAYSALQRGTQERAAVAVAAAVLRSAQERAHVDRLPTAVFCYNRLIKAPRGEDDNGVVIGVMTAIRRSGRVSYVKGDLLYDEFADLDQTYEPVADKNEAKRKGGSFRLFRFGGGTPSRMEYTVVSDEVVRDEDSERITLFSGAGAGLQQTNLLSTAFLDVGGGTISASSWHVGDGYAFEFAEVQLPNGFVFGNNVPSVPGKIVEMTPIVFDPEEDRSTKKVEIWSTKPDANGYPKAFKKVGLASANSEEAV